MSQHGTRTSIDTANQDAEAQAVIALREGANDRALSILMDAYGAELFRYCQRMVGETEAEDVHQMTFVHAYESFASFRQQSSLRAWLYGIVRHRCLDSLRRARRHGHPWHAFPEVEALEAGPDQRLATRQVLERCLQKLKPKAREVVILRYVMELSFPEMAEICQEDPATLQVRLARVLPILRKCIETNSQ